MILNKKQRNIISMAYKVSDMIKKCLTAINDNNLVFIDEIFAYVPFSLKTFYNHKLQEVQDIKNALEVNKVRIKAGLRKKWYNSNAPALQIALYRLIANEHEYERLILERVDHTSRGESINPINITVAEKETGNRIKKLIDESMLN